MSDIAYRLKLSGRVQGVGLRPFIYRLALQYNLCGWVGNAMGQVDLHIEGDADNLSCFMDELSEIPLPAQLKHIEQQSTPCEAHLVFMIRPSSNSVADVHLLPDLPPCDACLNELFDPDNRRYRYPFINCSHCGPRYSLLQQLPYDRCNTSMRDFPLCESCHAEYKTVTDRRFHAEPVACEVCGPRLSYHQTDERVEGNDLALSVALAAIRQGEIVAVKGVGGYHLACDARDSTAIQRLRQRKGRPDKPLAILGLESQLPEWVELQDVHWQTLRSPSRPIVLAPLKIENDDLAPGLSELGVMLPYSPLHYLLLNELASPLVVTSANLSGEPVLTDNIEVEKRLTHVADAFLHHDREILHAVDDPVYRVIDDVARPLRLGRGNAPLELTLPFTLRKPALALGGQMKNCFALAWGNRVVISSHIGELHTPRAQQHLQESIAQLSELYAVTPKTIVLDRHPAYGYRRWATATGLPMNEIPHHFAHASQLVGEYPAVNHWLVFTWDGVGLGVDNTLWGGEALLGHAGEWQRQASIRPYRLAAGDQAARLPWRSAAALCWTAGLTYQPPDNNPLHQQAWKKGINSHQSSSIGRLFDAASALLGLGDESSFEGQGPMALEALAADIDATALELPLQQDQQGIWRSDWSPLLLMLQNDDYSLAERAAIFHESLAQMLLQQALLICDLQGEFVVGLCGGVFQNRRLCESVIRRLKQYGFQVHLPAQLPMNDAGLAYGQLIEYHATKVKQNDGC